MQKWWKRYTFFENFPKEIHRIVNFGSVAYRAPIKITYFSQVLLIRGVAYSAPCIKNTSKNFGQTVFLIDKLFYKTKRCISFGKYPVNPNLGNILTMTFIVSRIAGKMRNYWFWPYLNFINLAKSVLLNEKKTHVLTFRKLFSFIFALGNFFKKNQFLESVVLQQIISKAVK